MKNHGIENLPFDIYLDSIIFWMQKSGGVSTYWFELIQYLTGAGAKIHQTYQNTHCLDINYKKVYEYRPPGVEILPPNISRYLRAKVSMPITGKGIFHSSYYRVCGRRDLANVVTVHDFIHERYRTGLPKFLLSNQKFKSIRKADIVVCVSNSTKNDLIKYIPDFDNSRLRVIHHGVSDEFHPLARKKPIRSMEFKEPYVLFISGRKGYKRFDLALNAIQKIPRLHLVIIGEEINPGEHELLNANIPGRWHHYGFIATDKLNELYNGAFALVYPSDYEGFGMPVLEAMRASCPVVCSSQSSLPEIAGNAGICVPEQTVNSYIKALQALFNAEFRKRKIREGLAHSKKFTWKKCFEKTLDAYRDAVEYKYG